MENTVTSKDGHFLHKVPLQKPFAQLFCICYGKRKYALHCVDFRAQIIQIVNRIIFIVLLVLNLYSVLFKL